MNIFALIGLALVMCVLVITVGQLKPEMSLLLSIACGVVLTCFLLKYALPLMDEISSIGAAGGINAEYSLTGSFTGAAADILYTLTGGQNPYTLAQAAADSFSLPLAGQPDKTLNTTGGTFEIIFGGSKAICKIVTADVGTLENGEIAGRTNTPNAEGNYEYTFSTLNQAMNFVTAHMSGTKTATIEMLVDYLIPDSDVVNIPTGYDITLTTATDGIYYYKGTGNRATISRDQGNSASFITANGALVSGDYNTFLTVQNLIFDGKNFGGSNISGGIIKTKACNVEINSVDFRNCVARFGGGIYIESVDKNSGNKTPYGSLKVTNSNFTGCQSQDTGDIQTQYQLLSAGTRMTQSAQ